MRKDLLHAIANLASTQGYKKAKEAIEKWDKETDVDRYWAMRIANIAADEKLGIQAARHAIDNPDQWDCRTESEKDGRFDFWDITPTLTRITETIHMMMGLFIVTVEAVIEKVVRQLKRNVPVLPT